VNSTEEESRGREMLDIHPLATIREQGGSYSVSSYWAVERVKKNCHVVGLSCEGFGDQLLALFTVIEASQHQRGVDSVPDLSEKSGNKGKRELNRLMCSLNYKLKQGVVNVHYET
jgi:hypothetical protein